MTEDITNAPTVFVVDDDAQVRKSMCLIAQSVRLNVQAFATAQEFLDEYQPDRPGCLVLDVCLPGMGGIELQERLVAEGIQIPTIFITAYGEVPMAVRALKAGAQDFIEKPFSRQEMLDRLQQAISRDSAHRREAARSQQAAALLALLSPREREVLDLYVAGQNTKKIAATLGISVKTVDFHRRNLLEKMQMTSLVELAHYVATYLASETGEDQGDR